MTGKTERAGLDIEAIGERYEERGFPRRVWSMMKGLRRARGTREYREARIELQRLAAPLAAVVSVSLLVGVLCVITAIEARQKTVVTVDLPVVDEDVPVDPDPDPEPEPVDPTEDVSVEISIDVGPSSSVAEATPTTMPGGEPAAIAPVKSPVSMFIDAPVKLRGPGFGDGSGFGTQVGGGGGQDLQGCLIGTIIDFKRDAAGKKREEYHANRTYWKDLKSIVEAGFSQESLSRFFVPGKRVALTHLWVPPQSAANGPKAFGVEKLMDPSGFVVHYKGELTSPKRRRLRLWGYFDDCMLAMVGGKIVLDSEWNTGGLTRSPVTGWTTSDREAVGNVKCPQTYGRMTPGDWFEVGPGKPVQMELVVGERPGGLLGGLVLVEEEGVKYPRDRDGSVILPIFATRPLAQTTKLDLSQAAYRMGVDSPRLNTSLAEEPEAVSDSGDVEISVSI